MLTSIPGTSLTVLPASVYSPPKISWGKEALLPRDGSRAFSEPPGAGHAMKARRVMQRCVVVLAALAIAFPCGCSRHDKNVVAFMTQTQAAAQIEARISVEQVSADDIVLRVAIRNSGTKVFRLLKWNLPADGELTSSLFEVSRNGQHVEYSGKMAKRSVREEDYLDLAPGREQGAIIGLAQGYDVKPSGEYKIKYSTWSQSAKQPTNGTKLPLLTPISSNEVTVSRK